MTDSVGRFRKIYPRLWRHPGFVSLGDGDRLVALYVLSGPQMNRIGLSHFSIFTGAEDLGTTPETFTKRLSKVCATFAWRYDRRARVIFVPSWFTFNKPENENVLKGILNDLGDVPSSFLVEEFAQNLETIPETLRVTFAERCRKCIGKRQAIQEQEPEHEKEQEREPAALRAGLLNEKGKNGAELKPEHLRLAREALKMANPNRPIDELIDTFGWLARNEKPQIGFLRAEAISALTCALSEHRAMRP